MKTKCRLISSACAYPAHFFLCLGQPTSHFRFHPDLRHTTLSLGKCTWPLKLNYQRSLKYIPRPLPISDHIPRTCPTGASTSKTHARSAALLPSSHLSPQKPFDRACFSAISSHASPLIIFLTCQSCFCRPVSTLSHDHLATETWLPKLDPNDEPPTTSRLSPATFRTRHLTTSKLHTRNSRRRRSLNRLHRH